MQKYKHLKEMEKLNNFQLIAYNRWLKEDAKRIREELTDFTQSWKALQLLFRDRIEELQLDMMEIEDIRLGDITPYDTHYMDFQ